MGMYLKIEIRLDTDFLPPTILRLPGMVKVYDDDFDGVLFVHPDRSWGNGAQRMRYISYVAGFELGQGFDEEWQDIIPDTNRCLGELFYEFARHERQETVNNYQSATKRGWTTWWDSSLSFCAYTSL